MRSGKSIANRLTAWFGWIGVPVIAVIALYSAGRDIGPVWRGTHGHGVRGTFTATRRECGRWTCRFGGGFVAADESVTYDRAWLDFPPPGFHVGDETGVVYAGGGSPRSVYKEGSREWLLVAGGLVVSVGALAFWGWCVWMRRAYPGEPYPVVRRPRKRNRHHSSSRRGRRSRPPS